MYKTRLPLVVVFNKVDAHAPDQVLEWMADWEAFQAACDTESSASQAYVTTLMRSMSMALEEFYTSLRTVCVSAATGEGMDDLFAAIADARAEYEAYFKPELESAAAEAAKLRADAVAAGLAGLTLSGADSGGGGGAAAAPAAAAPAAAGAADAAPGGR
jgi:GPN-loop GTPase